MDKFLYQVADKIVFLAMLMFAAVLVVAQQVLRHRRRVLVHRERLAAIDKGLELPPDSAPAAALPPGVCLLRGLLWVFLGAAFFICMVAVGWLNDGRIRLLALGWGSAGILPISIGAAYLLYYKLQRRS